MHTILALPDEVVQIICFFPCLHIVIMQHNFIFDFYVIFLLPTMFCAMHQMELLIGDCPTF
jgi:hypothetical protein